MKHGQITRLLQRELWDADGRDVVSHRPPLETLRVLRAEARVVAEGVGAAERLGVARAFCHRVLEHYWQALQADKSSPLPVAPLFEPLRSVPFTRPVAELAASMAQVAAGLDVGEAGYQIGLTYTVMLPREFRARHGIYYTPPALVDRLLDMATEAGADWQRCRVLDPACGGGAFLAPVAVRMARQLKRSSPAILIENISTRLSGFELDPFGAWMSQVLVEAALLGPCLAAGRRLPSLVLVCDALIQQAGGEGFDLVVGNPPYGRVSLSPEQRARYQRSLFGHANLYGLFTDLALRFVRPQGVVAYVTSASFLAGEYFKSLRQLLAAEAPPVGIEFVTERQGVFEDVLQEAVLATYRQGRSRRQTKVRFLQPNGGGRFRSIEAGAFALPDQPVAPWLVPRNPDQGRLIKQVSTMPYRLKDYGYSVSTGPLVWNRHKPSLREGPGKGRYPLIWVESVRSDGVFEFRACKRNHKPYFQPTPKETWVVTKSSCVLLQRTTAKEQSRRLIAAELPEDFLKEHGAVVVENHLNMIRPTDGFPCVPPAVICALLNSDVLDQIFRCINGSVAVSAYELEALPLPPPQALRALVRLTTRGADRATLEREVATLYADGGG